MAARHRFSKTATGAEAALIAGQRSGSRRRSMSALSWATKLVKTGCSMALWSGITLGQAPKDGEALRIIELGGGSVTQHR